MINCPNCRHEELNGTVYCSNCGAQLIDAHLSTHKIQTAERNIVERENQLVSPPKSAQSQSKITLSLVDTGQILPLADRSEFTLGRSAEGQPIIPDVDLSPFEAYANGVSRLHSAIKIIDTNVVIVDLGSSNGTYVNGARLSPYAETPVSHGDLIYLGKLKFQILIS